MREGDPGGCVLPADRHQAVNEGVRALLGTAFETLVMVADEKSGAANDSRRVRPTL